MLRIFTTITRKKVGLLNSSQSLNNNAFFCWAFSDICMCVPACDPLQTDVMDILPLTSTSMQPCDIKPSTHPSDVSGMGSTTVLPSILPSMDMKLFPFGDSPFPMPSSLLSQPVPQASGSYNPNSVFVCPNCSKVYSYKGNLNRHLKVECGKDPQEVCPFCMKTFKHKSNLLTHIDRRHKSDPSSCERTTWRTFAIVCPF